MEANAKKLCNFLKSNDSCLIGRNGSLELEVILFFMHSRSKDIPYPAQMLKKLELHAGIFPSTTTSVDTWCKAYIEALKICTAVVEGWYAPLASQEIKLHSLIIPSTTDRIYLRNLEPYYVKPELRWSNYLAEKKVAIINSFAETCVQQTYLAYGIWGTHYESILPSSTTWIPIQTYYAPALAEGKAEWPAHIDSWLDAVQYIVQCTLQSEASVAIIGCGGLGMIIGAELKRNGLQVIVLGGATQILFGIKGQRWLTHPVISSFFNNAWTTPPESSIPKGAHKIEGGCYWIKDIK